MSTITTTESLVILLRAGVTYLNDATVHAAADRLFAQSMRIQGLISAMSQERQDWAIERKRLLAERDEARREVCELRTDIGFSRPIASHVVEFAASRGWDCFKEANDER